MPEKPNLEMLMGRGGGGGTPISAGGRPEKRTAKQSAITQLGRVPLTTAGCPPPMYSTVYIGRAPIWTLDITQWP